MKHEAKGTQAPYDYYLCADVARSYSTIKSLPGANAFRYDRLASPGRWTPHKANFACDVELVLRKALADHLDALHLQNEWLRFCGNPNVVDAETNRLIRILTPYFRERELHPASYFGHRLPVPARPRTAFAAA